MSRLTQRQQHFSQKAQIYEEMTNVNKIGTSTESNVHAKNHRNLE